MSEVKKIATRVSYGNALVELAKEHDDVYVLDADLAAATQTAIFKKEFPDRHIDCGIAECNILVALVGGSILSYRNTSVCRTDFHIEMRISNRVSHLLKRTTCRKHGK